MSSYAQYRITDKKCATCSFWSGIRTIEMRAYKPFYVNADAGQALCMVQKGRTPTAATKCPKWQIWEKLITST